LAAQTLHVGLVQVELHTGNGTKDHHLHAHQAKKLRKGVAGGFWDAVTLLESKVEYLQDAKMTAAGASIFFVLGLSPFPISWFFLFVDICYHH